MSLRIPACPFRAGTILRLARVAAQWPEQLDRSYR
jgi:hypothetical protein